MVGKVKFGIYCNTQKLKIFYCFDFLIVHTNCMRRTVIILIFLEISSKKIRIIPLGSYTRIVPKFLDVTLDWSRPVW